MTEPIEFSTLLVPVDFSPASHAVFDSAAGLTAGKKSVIILLHVIDPSLISFASDHGWGDREAITAQMRARAEQEMELFKQRAPANVEVDAVISEGTPFLEIIRKGKDFAVDAIVIGRVGSRGAVEKLLFGTTAEKVLRGSRRPVMVLPIEEE